MTRSSQRPRRPPRWLLFLLLTACAAGTTKPARVAEPSGPNEPSAPPVDPTSGAEAPGPRRLASGGRVFPSDFIATAQGYALAYYPRIAWNPEAREWAVGWRSYEQGLSLFRLARISERGEHLGTYELASLPLTSSGFGTIHSLAAKGRGYRALLSSPLQLVEHDGEKPVRGLLLSHEPVGEARLLPDGRALYLDQQKNLWLSSTEPERAVEKALLYEAAGDRVLFEPTLAGGGARSWLLWAAHAPAAPNERIYYAALEGARPGRPERLDPEELPQRFLLAAPAGEGLAVVYQAGDYNASPEIRLRFLP